MPIKLNYRHSLKTMRDQMKGFNESFSFYMENGDPVFALKEINENTGLLTQSCGYIYSYKDMAEYINKMNRV